MNESSQLPNDQSLSGMSAQSADGTAPGPDSPATESPTSQPRIAPEVAAQQMLSFVLHRSPFSGAPTVATKVLLAVVKLFRIPLRSAGGFPSVRSLTPFMVSEDSFASHERGAFISTLADVKKLGFDHPMYHRIHQPLESCALVLITLVHNSGRGIARITAKFPAFLHKPQVFTQYYSLTTDDEVFLTWVHGMEIATPASWNVHVYRDATNTSLWAQHQQHVTGRTLVPLTPEQLPALCEALHLSLISPQISSGIMRPYTKDERTRFIDDYTAEQAQVKGDSRFPQIMSEITRLQSQKKNSWTSFFLILLVSMGLFVGSMGTQTGFDWEFLVLLVIVLLIHECGHYVAMLLSGYRNLKMFFIPFLGAAVSGQSYNVAGWKKTIVSLAGPVPGIMLGIILSLVGLVIDHDLTLRFALLLLIINGMNLLPILPLDGGWVAHQLLFSRHPWLDLVFRLTAVIGLIALGVVLQTKIMMFIAIVVAIGIPMAFRLARITAALRKSGFQTRSQDNHTIPNDVAEVLIERIQTAHPKGLAPRLVAQHTIAMFDTLNSRPPGWFISSMFLSVHGAALVLALVFGAVAGIGLHGGLPALRSAFQHGLKSGQQLAELNERMPHQVSPLTISAASMTTGEADAPSLVLVATVKNHRTAITVAAEIASTLPPNSGYVIFGDSLLVSLHAITQSEQDRLYQLLAHHDKDAFVCAAGDSINLSISATHQGNPEAGRSLSAFLSCPHPELLIPPWDVNDPRSVAEKNLDEQHRALCGPIRQATWTGWQTEQYRSLNNDLRSAVKRGDKTRAALIRKEQAAFHQQEFLKKIDQLTPQNPDCAAMLEACKTLVPVTNDPDFEKQFSSVTLPFLGLAAGDRPNLLSVLNGNCTFAEEPPELLPGNPISESTTVQPLKPSTQPERIDPVDQPFDLTVSSAHPLDLAPALVLWLHKNNFTDLHYTLQLESNVSSEHEENAEAETPHVVPEIDPTKM